MSSDINSQVAVTLETLSAQELAQKVKTSLEDAANSETNITKRGTMAFTDNTSTTQKVTMSETLVRNIENKIQMEIKSWIRTDTEVDQSIENSEFVMPCGETNITLESTITMVASDMAKAIAHWVRVLRG